ncbi:peptidoglycan/LPS O-acetylase OafA/YrhL [Isoptericola jiangsuensis]|uniref:Peptidoglycan/LPS O-acetylase OafA/YrhL n=1 Tax=Isoptericola jiangsuensis TaxID=548579 RepID=A0A2A9ETV4_9MICO|nr:acyltransferase family protein [Isoptericola jiangsuensis]PFG41961.1 peptidoglycan/LPS O-acetylase OafA/YrhL [Isoptericola jiangsuensis]
MSRTTPVTAARPDAGAPRAAVGGGGNRADIQGLRALAVAAVVVFHLWPGVLTGGYVGVDVFFVLSGFLITSHLVRRPVGSPRALADFWARRVRRLIPAATLVLALTLVAAVVWLPSTVLAGTAREVAASALYVENWHLARSEADYLAADQAHSPVQHYWSLSIEEQFYLLWPVLLGAATWTALRVRRSRARRAAGPASASGDVPDQDARRTAARTAALVTGVVVVASLARSVQLTAAEPAAAYFVSTTRFWELGLGGLLAALLALRTTAGRPEVPDGPAARVLRPVAAWAGLAMIVVACLTFDADTPFPGTAALLPTVGTALVVAAAADPLRGGPGRLLGRRPVQWLGDASYSVYLWHWPLVVIVPVALDTDGPLVMVGVLAATLGLAALSRTWVEERLRHHPLLVRRRAATFVLLAVCVGVVAGAGTVVAQRTETAQREAAAAFAVAVEEAGDCLGATVERDPSCPRPAFVTPPLVAAEDRPVVYADGCWNNTPFTTRNTCTYGPADATTRIALVGNSHAGHWVPALTDALDTEGWRLTTYLQSVCYTVDDLLDIEGTGVAESCRDTNRWAVDQVVTGGYDLVVLSDRTNQPLADMPEDEQEAAAQAAYAETLAAFTDAGIPVLVLRDTPAMPADVPDCVALHPDDLDRCGAPPAVALEPDPLAAAAAADTTGLVSVTSVEDLMCDPDLCHAVVGGLVAYFDHGHLTATFARTLAPEVTGAVRDRLAG